MDMAGLDIEHLETRLSQQPQSPLFARLADLYLAEQRVSDALALCENGVRLYPSYAGGHVVLGKCYSAMGRVHEARLAFHQALDLAPYNTVVQNLLISLPDRIEEAQTVPALPAEDVAPAAVVPVVVAEEEMPQAEAAAAPALPVNEAEPAVEPVLDTLSAEPEAALAETEEPPFDPYPTFEEYITQHPAQATVMTLDEYLKGRVPAPPQQQQQLSEPAAETVPSAPPEASTDFESIALKLQNAGRIVPADRTLPAPPASALSDTASGTQSTIVTQTMAEIYAAQNEFQAAIDAYEELIRKQPDQAKVFQQRIDAIRLLMGTV